MIFLCLLKWIGIILAAVLGLLLLLCTFILFVPVRYRFFGEYENGGGEYGFSLHWLLYILMVRKSRKSNNIWLCILGIPIKRLNPSSEKKQKKKKTGNERKPEKEPVKRKEDAKEEKKKPEKKEQGKKKAIKKGKTRKRTKKKRFSFSRFSSIIKFIREKATKDVLRMLMSEALLAVKHIMPGFVKGTFHFGTGDPAATGILVGIISLFPFVYQDGVQILPDFEESVLECKGKVKGRVRIFYILRIAVRVYRNREVRKLIQRFHKLKTEA